MAILPIGKIDGDVAAYTDSTIDCSNPKVPKSEYHEV